MQLCQIYLYPNHLDLYINLDSWIQERYRRVYNRNLKIYRGADNKLEFRVRSSDQKFKDVGDSVFVMNILTTEDQRLAYSTDLVTQDSTTGKLYVVIGRDELQSLEPGLYRYTIHYEFRTNIDSVVHSVNSKYPLYFDSQYGSFGTLEIFGDIEGEPHPSQEITEFKFNVQYDARDDFYLSSLINANSQKVTAQSLHTFQMYFTDYTGRVIIQGSLDQGGNPQTWSDLAVLDYISVNKEYVNITGKYNFFRVKHIPSESGLIGSFQISQSIFGYYTVSILNGGRGYAAGNQILIKGNTLGGSTPSNDLVISVISVDTDGSILSIDWSGRSYNGTTVFVRGNQGLVNTGTVDRILYR